MISKRARLASGAAALAALVCLALALGQFREPGDAHAGGWRLYWAALALAVAAAWPWRGRPSTAPPVTRREIVLLALVLVAGAAFRAYRLGSAPYGVWFDEGQNGLEAMRILAEPAYRPVFVPGISQLPALVFYYFAPFVDLLGPRILSLRLATTLIGLLAIVATWALGRELLGRRAGLIAAALLALSRWHVTFSRFAVSNLAVTLFLPLSLLLFVRALRRRSPRDAVLCGMALGMGLQSYYAMLAAPVVLGALFALEWIRGCARGRGPLALVALALLVGALAYAPVLQYARTHPREYGQRLQATTFVRADSPWQAVGLLVRPSPRLGEAWGALGANLRAHALMFHVRGDANGRHNLPGAPMLDPVAGVLFAIGLAWCLARPFDPRRAAVLLPFLAMMAAGVLSLTFEAPQGARTLGVTPFVALMGAVPLAALARVLERRAGVRAALAAAAAALGLAGAWSWRVFDRQLRDPSAWESYSTPETRLAEVVRAYGRDADVYVPPTLAGGPTITFLLGEPLRATTFERSRDLPLPSRGRPALLFFLGNEEGMAALVRELYPQASVEPFGAPLREGGIDHPLLWTARVPPEAIAALQGWEVADGRTVRTVKGTEWSWPEPPFTARVRGVLSMPEDQARAFAISGTPGSLSIDGETVLDPHAAQSAVLRLARGMHQVELAIPVTPGARRTALRWRTPDGVLETLPPGLLFLPRVPSGGLLGEYHAGPLVAGEPAFRRIDPQVAFYFHLIPLPRPFSVRWSGSVYAPIAGSYRFGTTAVDESSVDVDGAPLVSTREANVYAERDIVLDQGWHAIEVRYRALTDYSQVELLWASPEGPRERVPSAMLRPPGPGGRLLARDAPPPVLPVRDGAPATTATGESAPGLAVSATHAIPTGAGQRIAATRDGRLLVLSPAEKRVWLVTSKDPPTPIEPAAEPWIDPSDLAVTPEGRLYVLDAGGFVAAYSPRLRPERVLDLRPLGVYNPRGLALSGGEVLIADTGGGRVLVLDGEGRLQSVVGRPGHGDGELADPVDVARDAEGGIVVVDAGNGRIVRYARDGRVETWPRAGDRPGAAAERVDADANGIVWVGGGGAREVWSLAAGLEPRRFPLALAVGPGALAVGTRRLFLAAPAQVLEIRLP